MIDASVFGLRAILTASFTFPAGIELTAFADDTDPTDIPSIQIKDKAMGVNGDLVVWGKANPVQVTLGLLPNTGDDDNLQILLKANRPARGRRPVQDVITLTIINPDGRTTRYLRGVITDGIVGGPAASSGRLKSKPYAFAFEDVQ